MNGVAEDLEGVSKILQGGIAVGEVAYSIRVHTAGPQGWQYPVARFRERGYLKLYDLLNTSFTIALIVMTLALVPGPAALAAEEPEVPVINGMVGSCSANFTVTDTGKKPIYNAKIEVVLRYGFAGMRKSELEIGTNSEGKARVIGLPEKAKKPLEFRISSGALSKKVLLNPQEKCAASVVVVLGAD